MNFTPSNDYAELRTQARALATLADSLQKQLDHVSNNAAELRRKLALTGDDAVQAERATNEQLTAVLKAAEGREAELRARVAELEGIVGDCQLMGFLQPKADASPTHRDLVERASAAMAKGAV